MQLNLDFLKTPHPGPDVWARLDHERRVVLLDVLARLIARAAQPATDGEDDDE